MQIKTALRFREVAIIETQTHTRLTNQLLTTTIGEEGGG